MEPVDCRGECRTVNATVCQIRDGLSDTLPPGGDSTAAVEDAARDAGGLRWRKREHLKLVLLRKERLLRTRFHRDERCGDLGLHRRGLNGRENRFRFRIGSLGFRHRVDRFRQGCQNGAQARLGPPLDRLGLNGIGRSECDSSRKQPGEHGNRWTSHRIAPQEKKAFSSVASRRRASQTRQRAVSSVVPSTSAMAE